MKVVNVIEEVMLRHWEPVLLFGHLFVNTKEMKTILIASVALNTCIMWHSYNFKPV